MKPTTTARPINELLKILLQHYQNNNRIYLCETALQLLKKRKLQSIETIDLINYIQDHCHYSTGMFNKVRLLFPFCGEIDKPGQRTQRKAWLIEHIIKTAKPFRKPIKVYA